MEHGQDAFETGAGVDGWLGQRDLLAVRLLVELHEHEVPDLDVASIGFGVLRPALGAVVGAEVIEDFRARAVRTGVGHAPPVVLVQTLNLLARYPNLGRPNLFGLIVGQMDRDPQLLGIEPKAIGEQVPCKGNGIFLEVVAETEVAHHLEERQMASRPADLIEVVVLTARTNTLLDRRRSAVRGLLDPLEIGLEGHHA